MNNSNFEQDFDQSKRTHDAYYGEGSAESEYHTEAQTFHHLGVKFERDIFKFMATTKINGRDIMDDLLDCRNAAEVVVLKAFVEEVMKNLNTSYEEFQNRIKKLRGEV